MAKPSCSIRLIIPLLLTAVSICLLILATLGVTQSSNSTLQSFYFFRAGTENFTIDFAHIADENIDNMLLSDLENADLDDFYKIGLWNYCSGYNEGGRDVVTHCSSPRVGFWFDMRDVWARTDRIQERFPDAVNAGLKVYKGVARWATASFIAGGVSTVAQLLLGIVLSLCCSTGLCIVGIVSFAATFFILAVAITVSAFYASLAVIINKNLGGYGIDCTMGRNLYALLWIAVLLNLATSIYWAFEICCCTIGKLRKKKQSKGPNSAVYKRLDYSNGGVDGEEKYKMYPQVVVSPVPHADTAYEPYRSK